jgi:beta-lactam-binding protein with PASTA domain
MIINAGLNIKIEGTKNYLSGTGATVVAQSPAAGTKVAPGEVVTVTFRYMEDEEIAPAV